MIKIQGKLKQMFRKLPDTPGVYFFLGTPKRSEGGQPKILYIGKATSLKNRVKSYFVKNIAKKRSPLIEKMVREAVFVKFEKTDSVLEALLLESKLIKKYSPPYNTVDKDQKSFNYVVITAEKFPRILMVRERNILIHNSKFIIQSYFGPFPHGSELKEALKIVRKIFPFRDKCNPPQHSLENITSRSLRPCFNYQIGLCPGTCIGAISEKEYGKTIKHLKTFFEGNKKKLIKDLENEMKDLTQKKDFEKATEIKKKVFALKHIQDIALIKRKAESSEFRAFKIEAYDVAHISGTNIVGVMTVLENGEINKKEYRMFKIREQKNSDDTKALKEILGRRLKHLEWSIPNLIVVDGGVAQLNVAEKLLSELNFKIPVVAVTKDEKHRARELKSGNLEVESWVKKYRDKILLANSEAHRFAIKFHRKLRDILV